MTTCSNDVLALEKELQDKCFLGDGVIPSKKDIDAFESIVGPENEGLKSWILRMEAKCVTPVRAAQIADCLKSCGDLFMGGVTPSAKDVELFHELLGEDNVALYRW
eukprot:CAMPEP_0201479874 /NCGR_PEP_ID=MMETSP0151_2-20130828/4512_1 /ASSEMBLY_ACC=CAM_ASM_000257 /TAXON_ID=200890 /ORGANISM="Paramoeba atlantica, Strain 621/1 / CCAP 1560/9" /LENGTH=105 /DNA_ID=CAMNT_0047861575 /DNA_START=30 /DNA_END=344 /DNA_ORIENTATION=-